MVQVNNNYGMILYTHKTLMHLGAFSPDGPSCLSKLHRILHVNIPVISTELYPPPGTCESNQDIQVKLTEDN